MPSPSSTSSSRPAGSNEWAGAARVLRSGAGVLLLALVLVGLCELWFRSQTLTLFDRQLLAFEASRSQIRTLALGSSQLFYGIDDELLGEGARNLAFVSQDVYYDTQLLERNLPELSSLETVLIEVSPLRLGYDLLSTEGENRRIRFYDRYLPRRTAGLGPPPWRSRIEILRVRGHDPLLTFWDLLASTARRESQSPAPAAAIAPGATPDVEPEVDNGASRARYHGRIFQPEQVEDIVGRLGEAARLTAARGARMILVVPPTQRSYREALPDAMEESFDSSLAALLRGTPAVLWDLRSAIPEGQGYFRDADHLNARGQARFTALLAERLKAP